MEPRVQYFLKCYTGENLFEVSENGERCLRHDEPLNRPPQRQPQLAAALLPVFENPNGNIGNVQQELTALQRQAIRSLAGKLKRTADELNIEPRSTSLQEILENENLNNDEMQVVSNILSDSSRISVSGVAEHLRRYMTSRTFRFALEYLCYNASSAPEELTIASELVKASIPALRRLSRASSVYEAINNSIAEKLDAVLR